MQKYIRKISEKSHSVIRHYAMSPLESAVENFNMGAQLHSFQCATASNVDLKVKVLHWFRQLTTIVHFLAPLAQIWVLLALLCKEISGKRYTGAHLQSHSYKSLMNTLYTFCSQQFGLYYRLPRTDGSKQPVRSNNTEVACAIWIADILCHLHIYIITNYHVLPQRRGK